MGSDLWPDAQGHTLIAMVIVLTVIGGKVPLAVSDAPSRGSGGYGVGAEDGDGVLAQ